MTPDISKELERPKGRKYVQRKFSLISLYPETFKVYHPGDIRGSVIDMTEKFVYIFMARHVNTKQISKKDYRRILKSALYTLIALQTASLFDGGQMDMEQDYAKYHCTKMVTQVIRDDQMPPEPTWLSQLSFPLFSGQFQRWINECKAHRDLRFAFSIMNTKGAWPALGWERWWKALEGHKTNICSKVQKPAVSEDVLRCTLEASRRYIGVNLREQDPDFICPTPSSSLQFSREKGGGAANFEPMTYERRCRNLKDPYERECQRLAEAACAIWPISGERDEIESLLNSFDAWRQATFNKGTVKSLMKADEVYGYGPDYNHCRVTAVEKPAGVRIVTIHDANMGAAVQPAQKQLLKAWKDSPHSTFSGDLVDKVNSILRNTSEFMSRSDWNRRHPEDPFNWISGDYKEATDLLRPECTKAALCALHSLGLMNFDLCVKSLDPLWVHYPTKESYSKLPQRGRSEASKVSRGEEMRQTGGQMMGHWLSFPLLCAINCATLQRTAEVWIEESKDIWQEEERRKCCQVILKDFLVNGDDILFRCPLSFYRVWLSTVGGFGFKVSMGKNYKSPDFVMINSRYFQFDHLQNKMKELGYMNLRLIYGKQKSLDENGGCVTPDMIGSKVGEMIQLCPWSVGCVPHAMRLAKERYSGGWLEPNWFIPAHLGGNNLPPSLSPGGRIGISPEQRLVAAWMVQNPMKASLYCSTNGNTRSPKVLEKLKKFGDVFMLPTLKLEFLGHPVFVECERLAMAHDVMVNSVYCVPEHFCIRSDYFEERERFSTSCELQMNDWQTKALSICRAMQEKTKIEPPEKEIRPSILKCLAERGYLSPLSNEGFVRYWQPNWHCFAKPKLRPTSILKGFTKKRRTQWKERDEHLRAIEEIFKISDQRKEFWNVGELNQIVPITGEESSKKRKVIDRLAFRRDWNSFGSNWGDEWVPVPGVSWDS